jgi:peroxiredoxin
MIKSFLVSVLCFLLVFPTLLQAEDTHIVLKGRSADYSGDTLVFMAYSNMISFSEEELGQCAVDDSGYFKCIIPIQSTRHIYTYLGIFNCYLYTEPGMAYTLQLPRKRDKSLQDLVNPYFEETSIHLSVKAENISNEKPVAQEEELNFILRAFNDTFYPYYYKFVINAYGSQVDRKEFDKAEKEIRTPFDSLSNQYLNAYIDYRIGLFKHYGSQVSAQKIIQEFFLNRPVLHQNPAYMELFNEVFKNYFLTFAEEHPSQKLPQVLNREKDYTKVNKILTKEAALRSDSLRELVLIKGLYDGYYDGKNIPSSMIQLLDSTRARTSIEMNRQMVEDIMLEITKVLPGYKPPDFALYNSDSTLMHLSDFQGKYIYLNFCNSFGYYCVREYEYLRVLNERLKEKLSIITILVDDSSDNMKQLVENNNYPWTFLHFSNQPEILESYDIQTYPSYFLISPDGTMLLSPAPTPVENFEPTFLKIYSGN